MNDSTRRAIRTGFDLVLAFVGALAVLVPVVGLSAETVAKVGALMAALAIALSKIRNALEDNGVIPAVLKAPASEGEHPYPDPPDEPPGRQIKLPE